MQDRHPSRRRIPKQPIVACKQQVGPAEAVRRGLVVTAFKI